MTSNNAKLTAKVSTDIEMPYVFFNGENFDEVRALAKTYRIYGEPTIDDSFIVRPSDIPNLDFDELEKWWESTGEIKENKYGTKWNTHSSNNMPIWRKDELIQLIVKTNLPGYVDNVFVKRGDAVVVCHGEVLRIENCCDINTLKHRITEYIEHKFDSVCFDDEQ